MKTSCMPSSHFCIRCKETRKEIAGTLFAISLAHLVRPPLQEAGASAALFKSQMLTSEDDDEAAHVKPPHSLSPSWRGTLKCLETSSSVSCMTDALVSNRLYCVQLGWGARTFPFVPEGKCNNVTTKRVGGSTSARVCVHSCSF